MSGQRSWLCCTFASWFDSLSSAATSVAAKPNHGFFNCQHPCHVFPDRFPAPRRGVADECSAPTRRRSEEHTSELQSLMRISYAVFCLKKKNTNTLTNINKVSIT